MNTLRKDIPSYYAVVYDDISSCKEDDHLKACVNAISQYFQGIMLLFGDVQILLKKEKYKDLTNDTLVNLSDILLNIEDFAHQIYLIADFEFETTVIFNGVKYNLLIVTDPVAIYLKKL